MGIFYVRPRVIGIDLAGSERRPSGVAFIGDVVKVFIKYSDNEIVESVLKFDPSVIAIDAPLTMPDVGIIREVDREMFRAGYKVLPALMGGMRMLTMRGMRLTERFRGLGYEVIEVHPTSSAKALNIRKAPEDVSKLIEKVWSLRVELSGADRHMIDALLAAITALCYVNGEFEIIASRDGQIVLPRGVFSDDE